MATKTFNLSDSSLYISEGPSGNIATWGSTTFNTDALPKNGGTAQLDIFIFPKSYEYGTINSITISYKAYGTRTGIAGSKAQIKTGYWDHNGPNGYVEVKSHGDVGRGSSNATPYTDTLEGYVGTSDSGTLIFFKIINPIMTQTNAVYVSNISITIDYTPPHSHSYTTETSRTASTCCTKGSVTKKCSCGETQTTELALDPNNHAGGTEVKNAKSATCTATGYTGDTYCKGCGAKIKSGSTIAKKAHTEVTIPAVAPTCTATGLTAGVKCSVCNSIITAQQTVAKLDHNYVGKVTTQPTCTDKGVKTYTCQNDASHKYTEEIAALGHSYTSVVTQPTETSNGYTTYTCSRCGHSYVDSYTCKLTLNCDMTMGAVTGGGVYNHGDTVTLTATALSGYKFVKWNDGVTTASRKVTVTSSSVYTAYFELDKINKIYVDTTQPTGIYVDETNKKIVFVINGTVSTVNSSVFDTLDGYHIVVQNTVPSGMDEIKEVYVDTTKVYG